MKEAVICLALLTAMLWLCADTRTEILALGSWIKTPFSAAALEAERDAELAEYQSPVKGEFETTAQFEQRKKDATARVESIKAEYVRKIADARVVHESYISKLTSKMKSLLSQSRETVPMGCTLGSYDADNQKYRISITITGKVFDIVVPLDKAPGVKSNWSQYSLEVTRQLNTNLEWEYLEARLKGQGNVFASTDKAPAISGSIASTAGASFVPPDLTAIISFTEPSGNNMLDAEETATLSITITNNGKGSANMVEATLNLGGIQGVSYPRSVYFGEIKAGASQSKTVELKGAMDTTDAAAELRIDFEEQNGFPPDDRIVKFNTKALAPPDLYISDIGITDYSNNGKIEPGEQAEVRVRIHNRGSGMAKNVSAEIKLNQGVQFTGGSTAVSALDNIPAGGYKDILFTIVTAKTATNLDIRLNLSEDRSQFNKQNLPLNLAFNKVERTAEAMIISGKDSSSSAKPVPSLSIDVEQNIPVLSKPNGNRWAVIIGIETYRNVSSVRYALRDAEFMKEYFINVLGVPAENIYMKTDDAATLSEFKTVFDPQGWLARNAGKKDSEIFIYYSGHGAPDLNSKKAYLLPSDGNPNYASISGYDLEQLYANLQMLKVKQITLFLDSCFSGVNRDNDIILAAARPVFISSAMPSVAQHVAVFSAATGAQISSGYGDQQHGLFTYFLMKGLRGEADANLDKKITQGELSGYLANQVGTMARRLGREQDPQLQSIDPDRVLLQW